MHFTPQIHKAIKQAARWHDGQVRKGDGETPYVSHLFSVALLLSEYTDDEILIIAALFHDVLEDISLSHAGYIREEFGQEVLSLVREVSEDKDSERDEERPWRTRKEEYLAGLREHSKQALKLSCADKSHNLISLRVDYQKKGKSVLTKFNSSVEERMWFYGEVTDIATTRLDNLIVKRLERELEKTKDVVLQ